MSAPADTFTDIYTPENVYSLWPKGKIYRQGRHSGATEKFNPPPKRPPSIKPIFMIVHPESRNTPNWTFSPNVPSLI